MAHHEACQLYIEQQIKEGLSEGKPPYYIGKELAAWVEKLFETSIPSETIKSRARYIQKKAGEITTPHITLAKTTENREKQPNQALLYDKGKFKEDPAPRPGRPGKYEKLEADYQ